MSEILLVERLDTIVTLTINRPEKLNAMTKPLWEALGNTINSLSADESVRCIILRGAGEKSFSPGNDISEFETERSNKDQAIAYGEIMHATVKALQDCRHPIVAQIHGICVGGGMEIAALADIRICGESSRFGAPINKLGLVMAYSEMQPIAELVGKHKALEILLEGTIFDAQEALRIGLVSRVIPDTQVAQEAQETAKRIAAGAPLVARWHKKFARRLSDATALTEAEKEECFDCFDTEDFRIGFKAFLAKQPPDFVGR
ncbi:MAG: enoyl-CoA hydratase-related protein [Burkholderiaceae bacterium]|nr:enoyl-CoA hydratase-related protein [Burkholderiaceae bacterium]